MFLDTPRTAVGSACDALWAGTPVITVCGSTLASRMGSSVLTAAGLGDLICHDWTAYEELAVSLAVDDDRYMRLRSKVLPKKMITIIINK